MGDITANLRSKQIIARKPSLLLYAFFGYFMPSAYEAAVVLRKALS